MVPSKRVLIVSPDSDKPEGDFARSLHQQLDQLNVPVLVPEPELDWSNIAELNNYFAIHKPYLVVIVLPFGEALQQLYLNDERKRFTQTMVQQVSDVSHRSGAHVVLLSDYHVFGEETKSAYSETDATSPLSEYGEFLVDLEHQLSSRVEKHFVMRLGWVIGGAANNLFSDILNTLVKGGEKSLSRYRRGSPTWQDDVLRVLIGVIRQILSGAENWGVFHYCSADNCNEWEFGQAIVETLEELNSELIEGESGEDESDAGNSSVGKSIVGKIEAYADKEADDNVQDTIFPEPASSTLHSRRIHNNFGIQPRTWRQGLKARIESWLSENQNS